MANLTIGKLGATNTTDGTVQKVVFSALTPASGDYSDMTSTLYFTCLTGDFAYEIVERNATAPAMTNATLFTPTDSAGTNSYAIPPIDFNPEWNELYITSSGASTFSVST